MDLVICDLCIKSIKTGILGKEYFDNKNNYLYHPEYYNPNCIIHGFEVFDDEFAIALRQKYTRVLDSKIFILCPDNGLIRFRSPETNNFISCKKEEMLDELNKLLRKIEYCNLLE